MAKKSAYLTYKGKPLVRSGNTLFYGDMAEKYYVCLMILTTKVEAGEEVPDKILVQLCLTDPAVKAKDKIIKQSEKTGLYNSMDIASIWLERALAE